ncbi:MAG: hypothetical protein LBP92_06745, partial [Deltaproteobacteria bacterium]|nr:hypothetical protein [Deltaproteobacteria bacterium]
KNVYIYIKIHLIIIYFKYDLFLCEYGNYGLKQKFDAFALVLAPLAAGPQAERVRSRGWPKIACEQIVSLSAYSVYDQSRRNYTKND